tara:strand:- start:16233 stop:16403 length:171 start_codon:yes stop_codon:yes gene_type:complete
MVCLLAHKTDAPHHQQLFLRSLILSLLQQMLSPFFVFEINIGKTHAMGEMEITASW